MDRRRFLLTSLASAVVAPRAVRAQVLPRAVVVFIGSPGLYTGLEEAFVQGMRDDGYVNREHFVLDVRYAETAGGELDRVTRAAVESRPDVLVTMGSQGAWAARKATTSTPIVMAVLADPVSQGLVQSLAHPGGNLTGNAILTEVVTQKRLELLHEVLPKARRIGVIGNSANPSFPFVWNGIESAAKHRGLTLLRVDVTSASAVDAALGEIARQRPDAVMIGQDVVLYLTRFKTIELMARSKIPAVYPWKEGVLDGGLMSYAHSTEAMYRRAARFVIHIFKGAGPSDLPVEQATTFELVINLTTAKALGLTIPPSLLQRADQLIK